MVNKLGSIKGLEKKIITTKLHNLDEFIYCEDYNIKYLENLNRYLYKDFYSEELIGLKDLTSLDILMINDNLNLIHQTCMYNSEYKEGIINLIIDIYNIRPFLTGNTGTLIAFLHILNKKYLLNLEFDIGEDKKNILEIPKSKKGVNQKRLTKYKNSGIII